MKDGRDRRGGDVIIGGVALGPPDAHGRQASPDGRVVHYPGDPDAVEFTKDGVKWIRLGDGREMPYQQFFDGMMDGTIECGIHPLNLLIS